MERQFASIENQNVCNQCTNAKRYVYSYPVCYNLNQKEQSTQSTVHRDRWNDHRRGGNHEVLSQKVLAHCYSGLHLYGCCLWFAGRTSLVQIQITQGLLDGDLRAFTIRIILFC